VSGFTRIVDDLTCKLREILKYIHDPEKVLFSPDLLFKPVYRGDDGTKLCRKTNYGK
jgi:hypothetical protein